MTAIKKLLLFLLMNVCSILYAQQKTHPIAFVTANDISFIKGGINKYPLLTSSYNEVKKSVDEVIGKEVDVPFPKDPAGGYTHEKHKANYMLIFNAGLVYNLTGEKKYAALVKEILMKYAKLNPGLKNHPAAKTNTPGHLFHQALNDANWLVYAALGYDCIYNTLTAEEQRSINEGAFKPEVDYMTKDLRSWFDFIHNQGVWAAAGVGITGIVTGNDDYLKMALYGTENAGKSGFLAEMDNLFSPDGYYTEGPYYLRYALLPFYMFAQALDHAKPELKIFERRNRILLAALKADLQQTNLDGSFFPLNDDVKDKTFVTNELVVALDIAWNAYGPDKNLLPVVIQQGRVQINRGGASIAAALLTEKNIPAYYPYKSIEYKDGSNADQGGVSYIRNGKDNNLSTLIFKYASHGLSHGHFDRLNINFFDQGNEIITDYGSVRWVNVEQKNGGRYLAENSGFSMQTIAHNTIVVDEKSHFNGKETDAQKTHAVKVFGSLSNPKIQVVSAIENQAYANVSLHRSLYTLQIPGSEKPLIIDLFRVSSPDQHQYDLPFYYSGALMSASFKYQSFTSNQTILGNQAGYQYLWKEAEAIGLKSLSQFTLLNGETYYTVSSLTNDSDKIFFVRTGANDPNFNLRREPAYLIRKQAANSIFLNVIEVHGNYSPLTEVSSNAYSAVQKIALLQNDDDYTIAEVVLSGKSIIIFQSNKNFSVDTTHHVKLNDKDYSWKGPYNVLFNNQDL